jgi:hypothetical protein
MQQEQTPPLAARINRLADDGITSGNVDSCRGHVNTAFRPPI